jgi:hypothetical protein
MKRRLQIILNKVLKEQKDILYGSNSEIVVNDVNWIRSKKTYMVTITIYSDNIEESVESHPCGIEYMVDFGWPILGKDCNPIIISSLDVKL